jgi:spore coat protein U-like protein
MNGNWRLVIPLLIFSFGFLESASAQSCTITPASGAFGSIDVLAGSSIDSTGTLSMSCSGTANNTVRLCIEMGRGASAAGPSGERALTVASEYLDFEFYSDSARSQLWGSWGSVVTAYGTGGITFDLALGPTGSATQNFTAYARIFGSQTTKVPQTYSWSGSSPAARYGYVSASVCPTGGATAISSGSAWTATIPPNANVSITALNFGSTSTLLANLDSTATITVQATNTTPYSIGFNSGANASGSQRRARKGATSSFINYGLYTDSARSQAWTTSTSTTSCTGGAGTCVLGTGTGSAQNTTVYGRVPPQTVPAAGTFNDTVVVTVTF